jgi:4-hydroxybenzoyl-CoA thioesterase
MMIFVALDDERHSTAVREWVPVSDEDVALDAHARHLVELRKHTDLLDNELPRIGR